MNSNENSTYKVLISKSAANYIRKADRKTQERIANAIERIRSSPLKAVNVRRMVGSEGDYRYRVGTLRIVYTVDQTKKEIYIYSIGSRGDVYK